MNMDEDAASYSELAEKVKSAYNDKFFNRDTCQYDLGTQSANTISLAYGLVPESYAKRVLENIRADIVKHDYHLTTGSQGTKLIFEVLSRYGMEDVACELMLQKTSPSFGYMLENGATSIWERWEADHNNNIMNSRNQPMFASCCTWFYKCLGGIQPAADARGFDRILISPVVPKQLSFAETELTAMSGRVKAGWKKTTNGLEMDVTIPFNMQAEIRIPFVRNSSDQPGLFEGGVQINDSTYPEGNFQLSETGRLLRDIYGFRRLPLSCQIK